MTDPNPSDPVPPAQGRLGRMPYDLRPPTPERAEARMWNPQHRRLLTPKTFGWGYDINFYWLAHPIRYVTGRS